MLHLVKSEKWTKKDIERQRKKKREKERKKWKNFKKIWNKYEKSFRKAVQNSKIYKKQGKRRNTLKIENKTFRQKNHRSKNCSSEKFFRFKWFALKYFNLRLSGKVKEFTEIYSTYRHHGQHLVDHHRHQEPAWLRSEVNQRKTDRKMFWNWIWLHVASLIWLCDS